MEGYCPRCNQMRLGESKDSLLYPECKVCQTNLVDPGVTIATLLIEVEELKKKSRPPVRSDEVDEMYRIHGHSSWNRKEIQESTNCGCFHCQKIFSSRQIKEGVGPLKSVLCPFCGVDSVIGDASGININKELLKEMNEFWFKSIRKETQCGY